MPADSCKNGCKYACRCMQSWSPICQQIYAIMDTNMPAGACNHRCKCSCRCMQSQMQIFLQKHAIMDANMPAGACNHGCKYASKYMQSRVQICLQIAATLQIHCKHAANTCCRHHADGLQKCDCVVLSINMTWLQMQKRPCRNPVDLLSQSYCRCTADFLQSDVLYTLMHVFSHSWLIEVNASPSLTASSQSDYELKCRLLEDMLHIIDMENRYKI